MSTLHFVGLVECDVVEVDDDFRAVARAACLKVADGYLIRANTFVSDKTDDDESQACASAIEDAARNAMTWCERENTGGLLQ